MPQPNKQKVLKGRQTVDAYRTAHTALYAADPHRRSIPEEHTPLLKAMVNVLEKQGFTSAETDFEPKKAEILAKFWAASDLLNLQELGFIDREDFEANATQADREALEAKWK